MTIPLNREGGRTVGLRPCGYYHRVISKKLDFMGLSEKSGSPF